MPFQNYRSDKDHRVGLWDITEDQDFFLNNFVFDEESIARIATKHPTHQLQQYASRAILHSLELSPTGFKIIKDKDGKPHLVKVQGEVSFSHSHSYAAAIFSKYKLVGIDIQITTEKIERIAPKFISPEEFSYIPKDNTAMDFYHIIWGAKEALYKAYGRKKVEFKDHLKIDPFVYTTSGQTIGHILMPDYEGVFDIHYDKIGAYHLVYCIEKEKK